MKDLVAVLKAFQETSVMVVGDLMLDRFVYGDVDRISPESPVPVLAIDREDTMLGGAGNVLSNLCALGVRTHVFSVVGDDLAAQEVRDTIAAHGADASGLIMDSSRPTSIKTRYLARHQQLLRTDIEKTHPLSESLAEEMVSAIKKAISSVGAVVLSDYGKGVLTPSLIQEVIAMAQEKNIPVLVDPKGQDFSLYRGADVVTPNRKELALASGSKTLKTDEEIALAAQKIITSCGISNVVATRSEDGLSVVSQTGGPVHLPTQAREVFDVSGAGDTVIAALAAALATGADIVSAARLANIAGGIAVSKVGTASVRFDEMRVQLEGYNIDPRQAPLVDWTAATEQVRKWKASGLKVGLTNGCFDIVHAGHVNYLNQARAKCDRLIVALNHDASVRILKGPTRPVNDEKARAVVIGGLGGVDLVVLFGAEKASQDNTPCELLGKLQPDIYFKGGDYARDQLPEAKVVDSYGGEVAILGMFEGFSTTSIIERSRKAR